MRKFKGGKRNFILDHPDFYLPLTNGLVAERGVAAPTFTRATVQTVEDFEGLIKTTLSGEQASKGARRVENLIARWPDYGNSDVIAEAAISLGDSATYTAGAEYGVSDLSGGSEARVFNASEHLYAVFPFYLGQVIIYSFEIKKHSDNGTFPVRFRTGGGGPGTEALITLTDDWQRVSLQGTIDGASVYFYIGDKRVGGSTADTARFRRFQIEDVTGQANQNPSEYVSVSVESSPWHGCAVDGVKYLDYENGNTVTSNVVTELQGSPIPQATLKGVMLEGAGENLLLNSRSIGTSWESYGNTSFTQSSGIAPDGTNTATLMTKLVDGYAFVIYPDDYGEFSYSIYAKAGTATQVILQCQMNSSPYSVYFNDTFDLTSEWQQISISGTKTNDSKSFRYYLELVGNVNETIYVWGGQMEKSLYPSSLINTVASAVVRNADILSYPSSGIIDDTVGAMSAEFTTEWTDETLSAIGKLLTDDTESPLLINTDRTLGVVDGTNTHTGDAITGTTTLQSIASNWGASEMNTFLNGVAGTDSTFDDDFDLGATLGVGSNSDGTLSLFGTLKNLKIWKRKLPNNLLVGYTG